MPRRIPDYPDAYAGWNSVASIGSFISLTSVAILVYVFYTMCNYDSNKPNLKFNLWQTESYYTLFFNQFTDFFNSGNKLLGKSRTNSSSLEFSISTPADYHSFLQGPIMGSLLFVGFASWSIMSIASILTYIVIGGGLGNIYTEAGCTLTRGIIFCLITGLIIGLIVYLLTKLIKKNENPKWAYNVLLVTSLFLIIGLPYVYAHNQISLLMYHNLQYFGITPYVDSTYVVFANPLKFLGVLLDFYPWENSCGILKILTWLNAASVAAAGATIGLRFGNSWYIFMLKLVNNKKMVSYINLLISLVILTLIYKQGYLPYIMGECGWWKGFMGDEKTHFLSYHIKTLCVQMGATLFLCFGLKHLLLKLIYISNKIINFVFKKQITINSISIINRICTIIAVTVFGVMILNDVILFLSFKKIIAQILPNYLINCPDLNRDSLHTIITSVFTMFCTLFIDINDSTDMFHSNFTETKGEINSNNKPELGSNVLMAENNNNNNRRPHSAPNFDYRNRRNIGGNYATDPRSSRVLSSGGLFGPNKVTINPHLGPVNNNTQVILPSDEMTPGKGAAVRIGVVASVSTGVLAATKGLPTAPRAFLVGSALAAATAIATLDSVNEDLRNKRAHDEVMAQIKLKAESNKSNGWSWWRGTSTNSSLLPFTVISLPEHWEKTFEGFNDYSSPLLHIHYVLNGLCVITDCVLIITIIMFYLFLMKISNKYISLIINKIYEPTKYPKFTMFFNKYISSFANASANIWLLLGMAILICISYKSQQLHIELLNNLTAHLAKKA